MSLATDPIDSGSMRRAPGRAIVVLLMILALAATAITRSAAISTRNAAIESAKPRPASVTVVATTSLDAMPSFATALLLGGLRGPLVMMLWSSSESQKQEHDLEDFDTKIEWIRLLQPEFDTVHLFQIWNKAYNISVQMANLSNKYLTILDALDYGEKVDRERPDDINIISTLGSIYGDKLGQSQEHVYYRRRVRRETQTLVRLTFPVAKVEAFRTAAVALGWIEEEAPLVTNTKAGTAHVLLEKPLVDRLMTHFSGSDIQTDNITFRQSDMSLSARRERLDSMLDIDGNILPELLVPRFPRPAELSASEPWYDGSELQYLKAYMKPNGPSFPYGISTAALEFNDYSRAQALQNQWNERHIQAGETAVDGHVGLALERWGKDEWERGRRFELRMWGRSASSSLDPEDLEPLSASTTYTTPAVDDAARDAALYSYALAARLWTDATAELKEHIKRYPTIANTFYSHIDDSSANEALMLADYDYLAAMIATGSDRDSLLASALKEYNIAYERYALVLLKYYTEDAIVYRVYPTDPKTGQCYTRASIGQADPSTYPALLATVMKQNEKFFLDPNTGGYQIERDQFRDQRTEYMKYVEHCKARIAMLTQKSPAVRP